MSNRYPLDQLADAIKDFKMTYQWTETKLMIPLDEVLRIIDSEEELEGLPPETLSITDREVELMRGAVRATKTSLKNRLLEYLAKAKMVNSTPTGPVYRG